MGIIIIIVITLPTLSGYGGDSELLLKKIKFSLQNFCGTPSYLNHNMKVQMGNINIKHYSHNGTEGDTHQPMLS